MVDWNDNAKAAVKNYDEWLNEPDNNLSDKPLDEFMAARCPTQTKTVADAVEWSNGKWNSAGEYIVFQEEIAKFAFVVSEGPYENGWYLVCTREQFEAYVKEQGGEKWTHTYNELKCRTLINEPDREGYIVIVNELNEYYCVDDEELKPIKPTLSKADFADFVIEKLGDGTHQDAVCYLLQEKLDSHDII